ncbi:MAG: CpsD/CapB family tyrosine-protein kinase [Anaerolineae bacterium]|nr:MAG: CpsD/CapB family tyrosine-protein kinase [Anaerolineae bacterium]
MSDVSTLITLTDPRSPVSEAYRSLRTNLEFFSLDEPIRTLVVTSPGAEEGKSTVLANLAVVLAQGGKRVILADCDLRRPTQHTLFGLDNATGLTTMMVDETAQSEPPLRKTAVDGLRVLPAGPSPPNPAELLGSRRMKEAMAALLDQADLLLFDAPPVLAVTDALVLAVQADGVLLVVKAGGTKREHVQQAKERLERVNARIVGSVLNNAPTDSTLEGYYAT